MNVFDLTDPIDLLILGISITIALVVLYHLIQWLRASRNHRDSADHHAVSCLETLAHGCFIPVTLIVILVVVLI